VHVLLLALYLAPFGGDLAALVHAGREAAGKAPLEAIDVGFPATGYDGQFYYALARAPWQRHDWGFDSPAARHLRIFYPALAWLLSGGDARALLWVFPVLNLAAIAGLAGLGGWLALRYGLSPWWGFLLPLAVNAGFAPLRNLTDTVAIFAVCGLLAAWLANGPCWSLALWAAAAVFSREQNLAIVLILLGSAWWARRWGNAAGLGLVLLLWAGWVVTLRALYGVWPFSPVSGNFGLPLAGMLHRWTHLAGPAGFTNESRFHVLRMLHLTLLLALAVCLAVRHSDRTVSAVLLAGVALAVLAGEAIYGDSFSYPRVFAWLPAGLFVVSLQTRRRWLAGLLTPAALWPWVVTAQTWAAVFRQTGEVVWK
jgi:hypothetical protein